MDTLTEDVGAVLELAHEATRKGGRAQWERRAKRLTPLVLERDNYQCVYCGWAPQCDRDVIYLVVDHVDAISSDGAPCDLDNLVTACWECNQSKGARRVEAFLLRHIGEAR